MAVERQYYVSRRILNKQFIVEVTFQSIIMWVFGLTFCEYTLLLGFDLDLLKADYGGLRLWSEILNQAIIMVEWFGW